MKTHCVVAINDDRMAMVVKISAPIEVKTYNIDFSETSAGIYEGSVDEEGSLSLKMKLMMPTRRRMAIKERQF